MAFDETAFTAGITAFLANATITDDRFQVTQRIMKGVEETRREKQK